MSTRPVALVTGGARGIGLAICRVLADLGFDLEVVYRTSAGPAEALRAELGAKGAGCALHHVDVSEPAEVTALVGAIRKAHGHLDLLVNNAGILHEAPFMLTPSDDFWKVLRVNLGGVVNCSRSALPLLVREPRGRIVNIASIAGIHCTEGLAAYATSKAAIMALTKVLARELASSRIPVNAVAPGLVETDMTGSMRADVLDRAIAAQPVKRIGTPEEVAEVVGFLARAPRYLTGEVVRIDGGAMIH